MGDSAQPYCAKCAEADERKALEAYKEAGHEYRYRDQLIVQEFGLGMVAMGIVVSGIAKGSLTSLELGFVNSGVAVFTACLTLHLRNIHQDRMRAARIKRDLEQRLGLSGAHKNPTGIARLSAPLQMIRFMFLLSATWGLLALKAFSQLIN